MSLNEALYESQAYYSCTPCLSSCWTLAIEEGTLENVSCPSVTCVKQRATSTNPDQDTDVELVKEVVGDDLASRWTSLKEKRKAEIGESLINVPHITKRGTYRQTRHILYVRDQHVKPLFRPRPYPPQSKQQPLPPKTPKLFDCPKL